MLKIKILTGSVRPGRFNIQPATWIHGLTQEKDGISVELIDLEELSLPLLDEPIPPMMQQYSQPHTQAWSKKIDTSDGFIFVTPEYNHSVSPVLKNAIDYLWHEWHFKPVAFVSYGSLAGGARAVEHLRGIVGETKMYDLRDQILLPNYWESLNEQGQYQFNDRQEKAANDILDELIFWAGVMKKARKQLAAKE